MQRASCKIPFLISLLILTFWGVGYSQKYDSKPREHKLRVYVCDEDGNILTGIVLCSKGKGVPSEPTDITGRTEIALSDDATPGEPIDLVLVQEVRANNDWEIVPGVRTLIHAFNDKPSTFSTVPLRKRARRLESGSGLPQSTLSIAPKLDVLDPTGDLTAALHRKESELVIIYIQIGHTLYDQKRYIDSLRAYDSALEKSPDDDEILYSVTLVLFQLNRYPEALSRIEQCLQIRKAKPESIDLAVTYETYASLLFSMNRKTESEDNLALARTIRARLLKGSHK